MMFKKTASYCLSAFIMLSSALAQSTEQAEVLGTPANDSKNLEEIEKLSSDIQALKLSMIDLNKELLELEEQLLYPSSTKYSVFVSIKGGQFFSLESVKLKLDGKLVVTQLYDQQKRDALARGGIHKLFVTNLSEGEHTATVFFTGLGPNATPYKRAAELSFEKGPGQGFLELAIEDKGASQEAEFKLRQW
ncbi:AraC family transcriptional regulator [Agaribacterium haliotis]|uniref:AraC family transcriptional regulator n=1 Tax=Agaribacterium haliotis TaxID=2013869 RepID=UPI000BB59B87|nr:AraC family transcriptional regulator [Agaribacterium haliotis]